LLNHLVIETYYW